MWQVIFPQGKESYCIQELRASSPTCTWWCRWTCESSGDVGFVARKEGDATSGVAVHGVAVLGGHLRSRSGESFPSLLLRPLGGRSELRAPWLQHRQRLGRRDSGHFLSCVHRVLCHGSQAQRSWFSRSCKHTTPPFSLSLSLSLSLTHTHTHTLSLPSLPSFLHSALVF
jgi:hypothetical protein